MRKFFLGFLATLLTSISATLVDAQSPSGKKQQTAHGSQAAASSAFSTEDQKEKRLHWWREAHFGWVYSPQERRERSAAGAAAKTVP